MTWSPNQIRAFVLVLVLLAGGVAVAFYRRGRAVESGLTISAPPMRLAVQPTRRPPEPARNPAASQQLQYVVVHVAGAVKKPGVYRLPLESRNDDAIRASGGANKDADLDAINLAATALDGSRLYVPRKTAESTAESSGPPVAAPAPGRSGASARAAKFSQPGRDHLNLNTASEEELQRLPGVGPALAGRIVQHRKENGPFTDPEQLMDVSGIGEKKYAKMQPFVRVR